MSKKIEEFLSLLWSPFLVSWQPTGLLTLWRLQNRISSHHNLYDLAAVSDEAAACDAQGKDVYFGVGLRAPGLKPTRLGCETDVVAWPGMWLDLDLAAPG